MTISIEINPEVQARLATQASARGIEAPAYAALILEQAAEPAPPEPGKLTLEDFKKTLDRIAQFSHKIPGSPDESFSRQNRDHD